MAAPSDNSVTTAAPLSAAFGTRLVDRFVLRERLGEGGMGIVYDALDEARGETVALKTRPPVEERQRIEDAHDREASGNAVRAEQMLLGLAQQTRGVTPSAREPRRELIAMLGPGF